MAKNRTASRKVVGLVPCCCKSCKCNCCFNNLCSHWLFESSCICFAVPITDTWRSELRELCSKAGLIAEEPVVLPKPVSAPATPVRKTVYSGKKKII